MPEERKEMEFNNPSELESQRKEMDFDANKNPIESKPTNNFDDDISKYDKSKYLVKEISTQNPGPGNYNYWDDDRIKKGFNFGNGSWKDMKRYMDDNKKLAKFEIIRGEPDQPKQTYTPFKLDRKKYHDVEETPYGFIYNVGGRSITDVAGQKKAFGEPVDPNKNYGFTVTNDSGDETFHEDWDKAYNTARGGSEIKSDADIIADNLNKPNDYKEKKQQFKKLRPNYSDLTDDELKEELYDNEYWYGNAKTVDEVAKSLVDRTHISPERAKEFASKYWRGEDTWSMEEPSEKPINFDEIDGDYERSYGPLTFENQNDPKKLEAIIEKLKKTDAEGSLENAIERLEEIKGASYEPALGLTGDTSKAENIQKIVDDQLAKFGRIGAGLYDELDQAGYYLDENNKVRNKNEIRYDKIVYPQGTSKEYTEKVNAEYQKALPILQKYGIKLEDFGGHSNDRGGYEDNTKEIMDKYVFGPFRRKYPNGNNDAWNREYKELYDAIQSVEDKKYNDWWIRNK